LIIDSQGEFQKIIRLAQQNKQPLSVGIRVSTNDPSKRDWQHFGIPLSKLSQCLLQAQTQNLKITGLQTHSSQNTLLVYETRIQTFSKFLRKLPNKALEDLEFIDLGGGFPGVVNLEPYFQTIDKAISRYLDPLKKFDYYLEPGKALSQSAFHLVATIRDIKGKVIVSNLGINAVGRKLKEPLIINLSSPSLLPKNRLITGPLCSPEDIWGTKIFANHLREDDILIMPYQGHYTYSLAQNFIRPIPPVLTLK